MMPQIVYILWLIILIVAVLALPFIVWLLHKVFYAAREIERYLKEMHHAGTGIATNTQNISALDDTISTAQDILQSAGSINENANTIKNTLAQRAAKYN